MGCESDMSQQHILLVVKTDHLQSCITTSIHCQTKGRDFFSLFSTCDASLRALSPAVDPPIHKMVRELKHIPYEETLRELRSTGCKKAQGRSDHGLLPSRGYTTERA